MTTDPMSMRAFLRAISVLLAGLLGGGCEPRIVLIEDETSGGGVPTAVQQAFDETCVRSGCHDAAGKAGGLVLAAPQSGQILDRQAQQAALPLVELGNLEGSYLALKLLPEDRLPPSGRGGVRMPAGGPRNDADRINVAIILGWIGGAELPGADAGGTHTGTEGEVDGGSTGSGDGAGTSTGSDSSTDGPSDAPTHRADIQPIWTANCVDGCHEPDGEMSNLVLSSGRAYDALTTQTSSEATGMALVTPGNLDESYLWHKLNGTQAEVGGWGGQMPLDEPPLNASTRDRIEAWILGGALP